MALVNMLVKLPDEDAEEFLRMVREWEEKRPNDRHLQLGLTSGSMRAEEVQAMLKRVAPALDIITIPLKRNHG